MFVYLYTRYTHTHAHIYYIILKAVSIRKSTLLTSLSILQQANRSCSAKQAVGNPSPLTQASRTLLESGRLRCHPFIQREIITDKLPPGLGKTARPPLVSFFILAVFLGPVLNQESYQKSHQLNPVCTITINNNIISPFSASRFHAVSIQPPDNAHAQQYPSHLHGLPVSLHAVSAADTGWHTRPYGSNSCVGERATAAVRAVRNPLRQRRLSQVTSFPHLKDPTSVHIPYHCPSLSVLMDTTHCHSSEGQEDVLQVLPLCPLVVRKEYRRGPVPFRHGPAGAWIWGLFGDKAYSKSQIN